MSTRVLAVASLAVLIAFLLLESFAAGFLNELLLYLPGADKVLHQAQSLAVFGIALLLLGRTRISAPIRPILAASIAIAATIGDELLQRNFADRTIEIADIAAGACGVLAGYGLTLRSGRPRAAGVMVAIALAAGAAVTYDSYLKTRDYNLGILAGRRNDQQASLRYYQRAVDRGTSNPEAFNALAWTIVETGGNAARAVEYAATSLALRPDDPDTLDTYGWALVRAGRAADAVSPLERALAAKPDIYCIHYHLGVAYLESGQREQGVRHLQLQIAQAPKTQEAALSTALLTQVVSRGTAHQ